MTPEQRDLLVQAEESLVAKPGTVPVGFHRRLIRAMALRHTGDYGRPKSVSAEESEMQIQHAEEFLEVARRQVGRVEDHES